MDPPRRTCAEGTFAACLHLLQPPSPLAPTLASIGPVCAEPRVHLPLPAPPRAGLPVASVRLPLAASRGGGCVRGPGGRARTH